MDYNYQGTHITLEDIRTRLRDRSLVECQLGISTLNDIKWLPPAQYTARVGLTPQGYTNTFMLEERPDYPVFLMSHDLFLDGYQYPTFFSRPTGQYVRLTKILG